MGRRWRAWWRLGEREWRWRGLGVVDGYGRRGERGARRGLWGEGEVDVGRPWRAWWRRGERERFGGGWGWGSCMAGGGRKRWTWGGNGARGGARGSGSGRSGVQGGRGGTWGRGGGASGCLRRGGGVGSAGAGGKCAVRGWSGSAAVCGTGPHRSSRASQEASAGPGGPRVVPPGSLGGRGGPPLSMDPPRRGVVAAAAGRMGRVTVPGGVGPGGPLRRGRGGRGDTVPGMGGVAGTGGVATGGRWGTRVERSVASIPFAGAVRERGVVVRWGMVVGSGSGAVGVGGGGGGAAGGGGVGSGGPPCGAGGSGIVRSPLGCTMWWAGGEGRGAGLTVTVVKGFHVPGSVWPAVVVVCGGWMTGRLVTGMLTRVWTGSCWVAASAVVVAAGGRGAWVVVGGGSWLGLGFGLGRCRLGCDVAFVVLCVLAWAPVWVWGRVWGWGPVPG